MSQMSCHPAFEELDAQLTQRIKQAITERDAELAQLLGKCRSLVPTEGQKLQFVVHRTDTESERVARVKAKAEHRVRRVEQWNAQLASELESLKRQNKELIQQLEALL